jgi:hypothetical protein
MKVVSCMCVYALMAIAGLAPQAVAQTGAQARVSVQMVSAVDSARPAGQYSATVKNAAAIGTLQVPAGTPAVVKLVPAGAGASRTWTVELMSVNVGGRAVAVNGGSPSLGAGTAVGGATSAIQNKIGGILNRGQRQSQPAATAVAPSVAGARVYLPAGSEVVFMVAEPAQVANTPPTQPVQAQQNLAAAPAAAAPTPGAPASSPQATPQAGTAQPAAAAPAGASASTVVYENVQYQLQGCQRQAPHIICRLQVTNLGATDRFLVGGQGTYYIDQAGNRQNTSMRSIANCAGFGRCQIISNLATAGTFEFLDQEGRATQLVRLQIVESGKAVAQFTNVPVQ